MNKKYDVFLSYSWQEEQIATTIYKRLETAGHSVWLDKNQIRVGDNIAEKVFDAIHNSDHFAIILSRHSTNSEWVKEELSTARINEIEKTGKKIIPILYEDCTIPTSLVNKKFADFRREPDEGIDELLAALRNDDTNAEQASSITGDSNVTHATLGEDEERLKEAITGDQRLFLAMDIGGTKIYVSLIDEEANRLHDRKYTTGHHKNENELFGFIKECIRNTVDEIAEKCNTADTTIFRKLKAFGIAFPGPTDYKNGIILDAPNLKMKNYPLAEKLERTFNTPVFIDNDVNLGVLGESWKGIAHGYSNVVGIIIGTGIGGGIMIDNKIYRGRNYTAGEIGHLVVDYDSEYECGCGQKGCIEALASRKIMGHRLSEEKIKKGDGSLIWRSHNIGSNEIADFYIQGDADTIDVVDNASMLCGKLVFSILNLLNPDIIFFGGGFVRQLGDAFLIHVKEEAEKCMNAVYSKGDKEIPIVLGTLSNPIITGACKMAIDNLDGHKSLNYESLVALISDELTEAEKEILESLDRQELRTPFSRDPSSDLDKEKLRNLRNRGLIRTTEGLSFKDSRHIELTKLGRVILAEIRNSPS